MADEEKVDSAKETMKELEDADEPPKNLEDWPSDDAKYITYGGREGKHSYEEGPESKLGPSSLQHHEDGSVSIDGEEVDNPDDYKGDPIPGGPTDPNAPKLSGEKKGSDREDADSEGKSDSDSEDDAGPERPAESG